MHRQRLTHRCVGNAGSSLAVIWFQLGSNEGPLNRRFFGISGADSTVLQFVNSRNDRKSKCPIWCRLREIGSHFSFFSCTHTCTHASSSESGCTASVATMLTLLVVPFSLKLIRPPPNHHEAAVPGRFRVADDTPRLLRELADT